MSGTLEKLELTLNSNQSYQIYPIDQVSIRSRKEAFSIAPPGLAASDNIFLGVSGMQADITIQFSVWNDGTDRANGTHSSTVVTVGEQLEYLENTIHAPDFGASWTLDHLTGNAFSNDDVYVESIEPTLISNDNPKWKTVRMTVRRGSSVG